ncbi:cytochrome ubiquinol oxidase subunit II [Methyloceanibacter marginalis]|uniref:Ubiquinol oxidase subunit 2 n=1 Tax=Methyloceanibacter marginalis TaxID=1774971 RepID=A0A1E3W9W1_9HYPH|nr:cytochrome ubiquinol oxidase subunit II [Methyloceanibacter marginalis]
MVRPALAYRSLALALGAALLCAGCSVIDGPVLDPKGPITLAERDLLFQAIGIMMIVIIPVFVMAALFMWRYRGTNKSARYTPNLAYYWPAEVLVWGVPAAIIVWLGLHLWHDTYKYDPYNQIDPSVKPLEVQAIAQDWKWLFVYPEHDVAVVNELAIPVDTPVSITITSDTVMNSLIIPALGGQIYAMAGMQTRLNLLADKPGTFWGRNVQYSGTGFANQQFQTLATSKEDFDAWMEKAKQSSQPLDAATYEKLAKPSEKVPVTYYSGVEPGLFDKIIAKYSHGDVDREPHAAHADSAAEPAE